MRQNVAFWKNRRARNPNNTEGDRHWSRYWDAHKFKQRSTQLEDAELPRHTKRKLATIAAAEREDRAWRRYIETRAYALASLRTRHPSVVRLERILTREASATVAASRTDCDLDVAELLARLHLDALPDDRDRFVVYEIVRDWLADLAKAQKVYTFDDPLPPLVDPSDTSSDTLSEVKATLRLR